jgi:hypothetical protein
MIRAAAKYFADISPVFIDGLLYCLIATFMFCQTYFGGDEAAKYISAATKFWLNGAFGAMGAICGALKMFRSNTFAEHQKAQAEKPKDTQ